MRVGIYVFGLASIAAGVLDLVWAEFEAAHQPIQALSDHIPGVRMLAYFAALWLIAGGAAILWRPTVRYGAALLAFIYFLFSLFSVPRLYTAPHFLGYRVSLFVAILVGIGQQLILVIAAAIVFAVFSERGGLSSRAASIARWVFGLCCVDFGLAHLTGIRAVAPMVPVWMPLGGGFWAVFTGIAFVLAGLAIIAGFLSVLAARLLALMLAAFSVFVLGPMIFAYPHDDVAWGGNAYNAAAVGATWVLAEWLATRGQAIQNQRRFEI